MKASDLFVRSLEQEGVEYIFGVPGEENLDLLESLRTSKIQLILTRHEQAAGFMAATCGRLTGKVGVCLATLGPGVVPNEPGTRDSPGGSFSANGVRSSGQNNFLFNGVDNNVNVIDFINGAAYVIGPAVEAISEMKDSEENSWI